jgi:hypothetical protein
VGVQLPWLWGVRSVSDQGEPASGLGTSPAGVDWDPLLTTAEAAALYKYSVRTFEKWRSEGRGPPYKRIHGAQVRYPLSGLRAYVEEPLTV